MKWALVDSNSVCQNTLSYDGELAYDPPEGMTLQQINDWVQMGDNINITESQPEPFPVEVTRQIAIERLETARDENIENGVVYEGNRFYTDPSSQNLMMQAILAEINGIGEVFPTLWLPMSGQPVTISLDDAKVVMGSFTVKKKANYINYMTLLAIINASPDPLSVDISQGWS